MTILPVIFDAYPAFLQERDDQHSMLSLPLGCGTMLSYLSDQLAAVKAEPALIVAPTGAGDAYAKRIRQLADSDARIVSPAELLELLHSNEPSDSLLLIDPQHWPVEGYDFDALVQASRQNRWAVHAVAAQTSQDGTQEFVRCSDDGRVRRVRRYYDRVTWPQTGAIPYSLVTVAAVEDIAMQSVTQVRTDLVDRGMLSQDVPLCTAVVSLDEMPAFLALSERFVLDAVDADTPDGYRRMAPNVLVAEDCAIHPQGRLIGPTIIQEGASVHANAAVIGPAVVGNRAKIHEAARIVQSVAPAGGDIAAASLHRHEVIGSPLHTKESEQQHTESGPTPAARFLPQSSTQVRLAEEALSHAERSRSWYPGFKLAFDVTVAAVSLLLLSPLLLLLAVLIKLDSRGPIFFGHPREGKDGRVFKCLKFRTMRADAHQLQRKLYKENQVDGPQFKMQKDPRVTRLGKIMRASNLDELPQLFNVLRGQMSLVGPRPSPFRENQICVPWRRARLSVRPGITGLWQVCRHDRDQGDFHQWIAYDTMYVRNLSPLLDIKVFLATIFTAGGKWNVPVSWMIPSRMMKPTLGQIGKPMLSGTTANQASTLPLAG